MCIVLFAVSYMLPSIEGEMEADRWYPTNVKTKSYECELYYMYKL